MDIIELSKVARDYYNSVRTPSLVQGWEKYVLTDGKTALFVGAAYQPKKGEVVFYRLSRIKMFCASFTKRMKSRNLWKRTINNKQYESSRSRYS